MAPVRTTPEGAVIISYSDLIHDPHSLHDSIEKAFGSDPDCLGIILVEHLPGYPALRERLLLLSDKFASLPESTRERYVDARSKYSFGWSHGKEIMNGKPDLLKGSYYANPTIDRPTVSLELQREFPEYYGANIWPDIDEEGVQDFEESFKALGRFIFHVGCELATACQDFASPYLANLSVSLAALIANSQTTKARLLHYFPQQSSSQPAQEEERIDSWCGFHKDHSLLTGLCSAMYLSHPGGGHNQPKLIPSPSPSSGLYICTRGGTLTKVAIPPNALAFQTGEALERATDGRLRATPHCVRVGASNDSDPVSRETFALFMQPDVKQVIGKGETFGSFSKRVFEDHYGEDLATQA